MYHSCVSGTAKLPDTACYRLPDIACACWLVCMLVLGCVQFCEHVFMLDAVWSKCVYARCSLSSEYYLNS